MNELLGDELLGDDLVGDELLGDELLGDELLGDDLLGDELLGDDLVAGDELLGDDLVAGEEIVGDEILGSWRRQMRKKKRGRLGQMRALRSVQNAQSLNAAKKNLVRRAILTKKIQQAKIDEILASSPEPGAEEWAIFDQENWAGIDLGEHESVETISRLAKLLDEHGPLFGALVAHFGGTEYLEEAERALAESYQGTFRSLAEWAENYADDTGFECAEPWRNYVDFERWAADAEMSGDIIALDVPDGVAVFWNH